MPNFAQRLSNPFGLANVGSFNSPTFADIDGDGDLDAFVGAEDGNTRFFQNNGTASSPSFAAPVLNPFGLANVGFRNSPTLVDIDGDGDLDAFVGERQGNTRFFRNNGTTSSPSFAAPVTNPFGLTDVGTSSSPTFADIDSDGDLDAFVGADDRNTRFFQNNGTASSPSFAAPVLNPFGLADVGLSNSPTLTDFDGDGDLDAFIGDRFGNTRFFQNNGTASIPNFAAPIANPFGLRDVNYKSDPTFADIDGDGDVDAFIGSLRGNILFSQNISPIVNINAATTPSEAGTTPVTGNFAIALSQAAPTGGLTVTYSVSGTATNGSDYTALPGSVFIPAGQTTANINITPILDNIVDPGETVEVKLTATPSSPYNLGKNKTAVLRIADGTPLNFAASNSNFGLTDVGINSSPTLVDIDGDGDLDAFVGAQDGNIRFFQNNGTTSSPSLAAPVTNPFGFADVGDSSTPTFADIDGDGDLDAFVGERQGNTRFFRNIGTANNPSFAAPVVSPFGLTNVGLRSSPTLADIDGDGDLDAFVGNLRGETRFFRNTGTASNPSFVASNNFGLANVVASSSPTFADVDGDGDLDALVGDFNGNTRFFQNTGTASNPSFAAPTVNPFGLIDVGTSSSPTFADIDGDGDLDAFVGANDGNTRFFENAPTVTITPGTPAAEPNTTGTFNLTLSQPAPDGGITVNYTIGGTATNGTDYTTLSGSVTFAGGTNTATVNVVPIDDTVLEGDETVKITLTDGARYNLGTTSDATLTLTESPAVVNINPATTPSEAGTTPVAGNFVITLSKLAPTGGLTVTYSVSGTATNGSDYTTLPESVFIPEGQTTANIAIAPILDNIVDPSETVQVKLAATPSSPYSLGKNQTAILRIADETPLNFTASNNNFGLTNVGIASSPTLADIDGDGDLDALVGDFNGNTRFFRNNGTNSSPNFAAPVTNPFGLASVGNFSSPTFADVDGDRDLDAFVGENGGNTRFFRNVGTASNPSFAAPVTNPFGLADVGSLSSPTLADIDGDGDLDAFVGASDGNTSFFQNNGTASVPNFAAPVTNPFGLADVGAFSSPTFADVDGDGDLDALVGTGDGNTQFFQNAGTANNPSFAAPTNNPFGLINAGISSSPTFADVDADGDLDAFVGTRDGNTRFFENAPTVAITTGTPAAEPNTTGTFNLTLSQPAPDGGITVNYTVAGTATNGTDYTTLSGSVTFAAGTNTATVDVVPIDDTVFEENETVQITLTDGARYNLGTTSDAALTLTDNELPNSPPNDSESNFATPLTNPFGLADVGSFSSPTFADIDGDGDLDAFVGENYGNTLFFQNNGTNSSPSFAAPITNPFGLTDVGHSSSPTFADIDGDGDLDAFVGESDGSTLFFQNAGTASSPSFVAPVTNPFGLADVGDYSSPTFADIDGDRDLDAFVGADDGNTLFFQNVGTTSSPSFAAPITNPFGLANVGTSSSPTFADIDGDGDLDAFVGADDGNTRFLLNAGTASRPSFAAPVTNPFGFANVGTSSSPTFADIDGDRDLDAFVGTGDGNTLFFKSINPVVIGTVVNIDPATTPSEAGTTPVAGNFVITLNQAAPVGGLTVTYSVSGTATSDSDYTALPESVFIPEGQTTANIEIVPILDNIIDPGETVEVKLTANPSSPYNLGQNKTAVLRITDQVTLNFTTPVTNPFGLANVGTYSHPTFADLDGDGDLDAFVGENGGNTLFFQNNGTASSPSLAAPVTNPFGLADVGTSSRPTFADIDGDGDLDAFVGANDGSTHFFQNNGTTSSPSFAAPVTNPFGLADVGDSSSPTFADIDGDGDLDAFVGGIEGYTRFFRNDGTASNPSFAAPVTNPFGLANVGSFSSPTLADIDGDGDLDAFVGGIEGYTRFFRNDGTASNPSFVAPAVNPLGLVDVGYSSRPTFADIDGDGDLDAFVGADNGNTHFFENAPTVAITAGSSAAEPNTTGTFNLTLSQPAPDGDITVNYTVGGTATNGTDYTTLSGSVTFAAGTNTATVDVVPIDDTVFEGDETVQITLADGARYNLETTSDATLTLTDNELASSPPNAVDDTVTVATSTPVNINPLDNDSISGSGGNDLLTGNDGNDTLIGNGGNHLLLQGDGGNDRLFGNNGNDTLIGGGGNDTLIGGAGVDSFVYKATTDARDAITDFSASEDALVLTDLFTSLGYTGTNPIADGFLRFVQSGANANVQIDSNGGANSFITLATLNNVVATDLVVGTNVLI